MEALLPGLVPKIRAALAAGALLCLTAATGSAAAGPVLIRDAEIEATLRRVGDPIFRAAGLSPSGVKIYLIQDPEMNAFVAGGQNIFLHTGMIDRMENLDQLRGVIAHETGHIAGGHLARRDQAMSGGRNMMLIGMLGAAAAGIAGAPDASVAIAAGSQQVATRNLLAYSRGEEAAADQAGARYVSTAGGDPAAVLDVLRILRGQEALMGRDQDPYTRTHPMSSERIMMLENRIAKMPKGKAPDPEDVYWYDRMVTKLRAFTEGPAQTIRANPPVDTSEMATLARAIAYHRQPDTARAAQQMDALLALRPDDPYYIELKGQFLLEGGKAGPAAAAYRRASELAPDQPLILAGLGRALLNTDDPGAAREARDVLSRATRLDRKNSDAYRDLALAEARLGNEGAAALATAERYSGSGTPRDVLRNATRAADLLPVGSPGWRRAQDMITMARRALKK
ncbi:MAG: peptidase M48 [Rhodovulum sulfidophilum]|uniref:Peptidase M48 n=1 Tax=Rhodovulum sulfidophilum TaxID=35806 RepID=A0A2W5PWH0_RHOSU|nr:MAG: peptidase M48 [Rhodovulum sulfidophilum]